MADGNSSTRANLGAIGLRVWRVLAVLGVAVTFVTTHWPRLVFTAEAPSDKVLHAITFGVLAFLVWRARWVTSVRALLVVMIAFAAFDERTQSLELFKRHTSMDDWIADVLGILIAALFITQLPRAISPVARMRAALVDAAERAMFDRPFTWVTLATSAVLGLMVGGLLGMADEKWVMPSARPFQSVFIGAVGGMGAFVFATWFAGVRAGMARIAREKCCFGCGAPNAPSQEHPSANTGCCANCKTQWQISQWTLPVPSRGVGVRVARKGYVTAGITVVAVMFAALLFPALLATQGWLSAPSDDMRWLFYCALTIFTVTVALRPAMRDSSRARELEGAICMKCGHDLTGTDAPNQVGRCPECGGLFARLD